MWWKPRHNGVVSDERFIHSKRIVSCPVIIFCALCFPYVSSNDVHLLCCKPCAIIVSNDHLARYCVYKDKRVSVVRLYLSFVV